MKFKNLLATLAAGMLMVSGIQAQSLKPGTVTFKNIHGSVVSHNINTGATEEITVESLLTEGFVIETKADGYLDIVFSNGVVGRLAPNSQVLIDSFAVNGSGRNNRDDRMNLTNARTRSTSSVSNLHLKLQCGDIVVNATEKEEGDLIVSTPTVDTKAELTKFFVSHGSSNAPSQNVSRAINFGTMPIEVTSHMDSAFTDSNEQVSYGYFNEFGESQSTSIGSQASAVVISDNSTAENEKPNVLTGETQTNDSFNKTCDKAHYSLLPYDNCTIDRLSSIADHALRGGVDPMGNVLITAAAASSTYFNVASNEVGELKAGMMLPEGSIVRTQADGSVTAVFPNGAIMTVEPSSNAYLESISTQPVLSDPIVDNQTNIMIRVESGRIVANTMGTPTLDTFGVISPLDRHSVASNTIVSVEFLQVDSNAFQTVSKNETPEGSNGVNTVVVTSTNLSFVSDNVTFIEYAQDGADLSFTTPPSYTHITESAIIPPDYAFIDRTIAFAAAAIPAPTNIGTPGNPGNVQRFTDEQDPVSP